MELPLGISPCPNDTFLFYALLHGRIPTGNVRFRAVLKDVETLNRWALEARLPLTKASYAVLGQVLPSYLCLRSGGALGSGCGPLVVAREVRPLDQVAAGTVAVPGEHTTANLLWRLRSGAAGRVVPMRFNDILSAVCAGKVDAGVIIHESRFTYGARGLVALEDLGQWWEADTGLPIPLGCILASRTLRGVDPLEMQGWVRASAEYAFANPDEPMEFVARHAAEMDESVMREHIALYVNRYAVDVGEDGERAVHALQRRGEALGLFSPWGGAVFPSS